MNREIKFRAWDEVNKKLIKFDLKSIYGYETTIPTIERHGVILPDCETYLNYNSGYGDKGFNEDLIIMEFTGLKDKNGVEIYEGDICLVTIMPENYKEKMVVVYSKLHDGFRFQDEYGETWHITNTEIEVIGNIYE